MPNTFRSVLDRTILLRVSAIPIRPPNGRRPASGHATRSRRACNSNQRIRFRPLFFKLTRWQNFGLTACHEVQLPRMKRFRRWLFDGIAVTCCLMIGTVITMWAMERIQGFVRIPVYQSSINTEAYCIELSPDHKIALWAWAPILPHTSRSNSRIIFTVSPFTACAVMAIFPLSWLWWQRRCRRVVANRNRDGLCLACGYDLRATPNRCPECGTISAHAKISK